MVEEVVAAQWFSPRPPSLTVVCGWWWSVDGGDRLPCPKPPTPRLERTEGMGAEQRIKPCTHMDHRHLTVRWFVGLVEEVAVAQRFPPRRHHRRSAGWWWRKCLRRSGLHHDPQHHPSSDGVGRWSVAGSLARKGFILIFDHHPPSLPRLCRHLLPYSPLAGHGLGPLARVLAPIWITVI
jgi:hypothetical protein